MEPGTLLLRLALLFVAARLAAELAERLRVPAVLAEIGAGVLLGPSLFGVIANKEPLSFLGELGAIFLLLEVGMNMDLADLRRVGRSAMQVAWIGVLVPLVAGFAAMRAMGLETPVALFLAAGITATSVGITARVFADMRALASVEAQTVLGAAVADDVIGLMILTVVTRLSLGRGVQLSSIVGVASVGVLFLVGATALGAWLAPPIFGRFIGRSRIDGTLIGAAVAFTLGIAGLAAGAALAPIVGAFVAGVALSRTPQRDDLRRRLAPVGHLFVPVFFLLIGAEARVQTLASPRVVGVAAVLGIIAVAGKILAGIGVPRGEGDRLLIGVGMIPRGEVGVVFATLGLSSGVLGASEHATLLLVVLASTIVAPPWLRRRIERSRREARDRTEQAAPDDGWLVVDDDEVELRAEPPADHALRIGLEAALLCADRRPGVRLLDWLSKAPNEPPKWDAELLGWFLSLLRTGTPRSWRMLDVTGVLQTLLPELDVAMRRRKHDPFELDPASSLRWDEVEALNRLVADPDDPASGLWPGVDQEAVLLAAFIHSAFGESAPRTARHITQTLGLDEELTSTVQFLVTESELLPAAAKRLSMGTEENVLELAAHVGDRERCDALYVLAAAAERDPTARERLDELRRLIATALCEPDLTSSTSTDIVESRKRAVVDLLPRASRSLFRLLEAAPRRYFLAHTPEAISHHLRMLDPPPTRNEVRIRPDLDLERDEWTTHVATLDRPGALAAITGALASCGIPIVEASIATWAGFAVGAFRVTAARDTDWRAVRETASAALARHGGRNGKPTPIEGRLHIDNVASPWQTIVEVRAKDRSGLLHRVADALSRAGIQIHYATVRTVDGVAVDTFGVTRRDGHKLDRRGERDLRLSFEGKLARRWTPGRMWRRPAAEIEYPTKTASGLDLGPRR